MKPLVREIQNVGERSHHKGCYPDLLRQRRADRLRLNGCSTIVRSRETPCPRLSVR